MTRFLIRRLIRNPEDAHDPGVRRLCGSLSGLVGMFSNLVLFAAKMAAGSLSASVAVTADAFNSLSDAASSLVTLLGFHLAGRKPDRKHPFGYGRIEYLSGLAVSVAILVTGIELARTSVGKILHPSPVGWNSLIAVILILSVLVKGWLALFNRKLGTAIGSAALLATAGDSLSDAVSTAAVLAGLLISRFAHVNLDGWIGALVSCFILHAGISSLRETADPLLGRAPDPELVRSIREIAGRHPEILGIHDLNVHDYGPGRLFASFHAEMDRGADVMVSHDTIDNLEKELYRELRCETSIHMDPVVIGDPHIEKMKPKIEAVLASIDPELTYHDFRLTRGPDHCNLIFDIVRPPDCRFSDAEIREKVREAVSRFDGTCYCAVTIDTLRT